MVISAINNNRIEHNVKSSAAIGVAAAGLQGLLLPSETKNAIKNTIIGQDAFIKNIEKSIPKAEKTFGQVIDANQAVKYSKKIFPAMKQNAATAAKSMSKTFAIVSLGAFAGELIADKISKK